MMTVESFLDSIVIVMVNTTLPANIGSAARAMHTMGLSQLTVVAPKLPIDEDAIAHAAGAAAILQTTKIVPTLETAIADCHWVLAASSRKRTMPQLVITPRQAANLMMTQFLQQQAVAEKTDVSDNPFKIALIFGREDRGLTNEELQLADYHIQIPANPNYGVLNVAAAVQVIASVFFETAVEQIDSELLEGFSDLSMKEITENPQTLTEMNHLTIPQTSQHIFHVIRQEWDENPISHEQKQRLQSKVLQLLEKVELYHPDKPKLLPHRLARLTQRLQLDVKEYELLQSLIAKLQKHVN